MTPQEAIESIGLKVTSMFVPQMNTETCKLNDLRLNYVITLHHGSTEVLTTTYTMGTGYVPTGADRRLACASGHAFGSPILPKDADVIYCLVCDLDVLNYTSFEDWATSIGYDPDSITALRIYEACLIPAKTIQAHLSKEDITLLQDAFSEY